MNKRLYLSPPDITGNEIKYVMEAFETNWIAPLGPNVVKFENMVADKVGINSCLALSSGTAGIHLALKYLGVSREDRVFCSSLTFAASCNPITYQGAIPVFIDSEPDSWNMSPKALEKAFIDAQKNNNLPKAVIVVNIYGQSADYDNILAICNKYNVPIIEDAAESLGAFYKGTSSGTIGKFGVFSFNGNKLVTTSGGGMLISNDKQAIAKCRFWATQAREEAIHYEHTEVGYNYRLSNVLAGIGIGQFEMIDKKIEKRKKIYNTYKDAFSENTDIEMMRVPSWSQPNYWLSVILLGKTSQIKPSQIIQTLENENIESRPIWKPMHLQPVYRECDFYSHYSTSSVAEDIFERGVCLPSGGGMTADDQERVIETVKHILRT